MTVTVKKSFAAILVFAILASFFAVPAFAASKQFNTGFRYATTIFSGSVSLDKGFYSRTNVYITNNSKHTMQVWLNGVFMGDFAPNKTCTDWFTRYPTSKRTINIKIVFSGGSSSLNYESYTVSVDNGCINSFSAK